MNFIDKLSATWARNDSLLCVGLDPDVARLPAHLRERPDAIVTFCKAIIEYLAAAPRVATESLDRSRARVSAAYTHSAELSQGPRGIASADYTTVVKTGPRVL